jgi:phosphoenolpyruvate-protein kinase (PTS system EI component)
MLAETNGTVESLLGPGSALVGAGGIMGLVWFLIGKVIPRMTEQFTEALAQQREALMKAHETIMADFREQLQEELKTQRTEFLVAIRTERAALTEALSEMQRSFRCERTTQ